MTADDPEVSTTAERLVKVHFLPDDVTVDVVPGETIMAVARKAEVYLNNACGGNAVCGKCRVIVNVGILDSPPTTLLTRDEIKQNYVLACETTIWGPAEIIVPDETRMLPGRIPLDLDAHRLAIMQPSGLTHIVEAGVDPLVRKVYVELSPPTSEDTVADHERLSFAVGEQIGIEPDTMQTGFNLLQELSTLLRQARWKVTAIIAHRGPAEVLVEIEPGDTSRRHFGVAVDIGTTTVVAHLINLANGETIDAEATYNSQARFGEDYIARIIYAVQNDALDEMTKLVLGDVNHLIEALANRQEINLTEIGCVMCAGNTAMMHFLLGMNPAGIRSEPYVPSANIIPSLRAGEAGLRISARGVLYCLPSVAAYVGSDITAGILAIGLHEAEEIALFVDIGTNGEVVLGNREWLVCCSASAGPAFEGSGVRHGMRAAQGAIEKLTLVAGLDVAYVTIDNAPPCGICGSGLLDCLAEMLRTGVIDRTGRIQMDLPCDRIRQGHDGPEFVIAWQQEAGIQSDIAITQFDIQNLMRSKAAIYAAISVLIESLGLSINDIHHVLLAGGFGNYLDVDSAITIGMLPDMPRERIKFVGNTAVAGAKMALLSNEAFHAVHKIASEMTYFDLMSNPRYMDEFVQAQFLPHTNLDEFPSVAKAFAERMPAVAG